MKTKTATVVGTGVLFTVVCIQWTHVALASDLDEAVRTVIRPAHGFGNMSPFELQTHYRLMSVLHERKYKYEKAHAPAWRRLMCDERQNMYGRLCAAYFLFDDENEAREFLEQQVKSANLRHRYNAAEVLRLYVGRSSDKRWGLDLLIRLLSGDALDGSGVRGSPAGEFPDGDRDDVMHTPIDEICWSLGFIKEKRAVPALVSVLDRRPSTGGAAFALGEIGDERAIPVLMKVLNDKSGRDDREATALGKLKCRDAVLILVARLGHPRTSFSGLDVGETQTILEALLAIGDQRATPYIEEYLRGSFPEKAKAAARRVLAQLKSPDPVASLLELFEAETYEPERSDIIEALTKYKQNRVVDRLAEIARSSDSAFMRREAIFGLRAIGNRRALLALASLFDVTFSRDLKAEWGWNGTPDFSRYFPETISMCLKQCTKQDFGMERAAWEKWIEENVEPDHRGDKRQKP